jgi:hypothetical protein
MAASILESSRRRLDIGLVAIGGAAPATKMLQYERWQQEQNQWCWAACAGAIAAYYDAQSSWTQCSIVCAELGQTHCCATGNSDDCNQSWFLDRALNRVGHLDAPIVANALPWNDLVTEIVANQPIGARIAWNTGGGHFVVIDGFDSGGGSSMVDVQDPWDGHRLISYQGLCTTYPGSGSWSHSYKTTV